MAKACTAVLLLPLALLAQTLLAQTLLAQTLSSIDNGTVKIGVDLDLGGSITWVSRSDGPNMINSADLGRQIQQSYYSGPAPYRTAHPAWPNWPWNPISTGDVYKNPSRVLRHRNDGTSLYVRSVPLQWALNNVPCECTFETWITLKGSVIAVKARLNNLRPDRTQYRAYDQELPAVYTNGPWHRLFTYDGERPFTGAPLRQVVQNPSPPWASWQATENWAALVDEQGFGLGVFHAGVMRFLGGFHGRPGSGGAKDDATGYIAPVQREILDHNIRYAYEYKLIVGSLAEIREYVYAHRPPRTPDFVFHRDRQHFSYTNATDTGMPVRGHLRIAVDSTDPYVVSPPLHFNAADVPKLYIRAAYHTSRAQAQLFWSTPSRGFSEAQSVRIGATNDGVMRTYEVDLSANPSWSGIITGLRFDPVDNGVPGDFVDLRFISSNARSTR
ncbi:MAG: hypothetical protein HY820_13290 [Acidobacteria bacterium]|nr:hypothetical protein [Acidobacteriota bacterium]